ncbi:hypothetical protein F5B22DRAFT_646369 [Xylaria bambusicola]|uniref:uncharacterized protein n=1 Tax=Xylaria bambusicola TaxID=326684 RepID=UPI0020076050|nr:uncharacterized protein F5B22DRAFT_646369 [Xylaria bambusicola]KAI0517015.1 hypothetical protein F5B22DRAFT_646369 [Xylaria bambusicola]
MFRTFLRLIVSPLWGIIKFAVALCLLLGLAVIQSTSLGRVGPPITREFAFANAVQLASFNNTVTNSTAINNTVANAPGITAVMKFSEFAHNISAIDTETETYRHLQDVGVTPHDSSATSRRTECRVSSVSSSSMSNQALGRARLIFSPECTMKDVTTP